MLLFVADDLENAPPKDPVTRYRFFGYFGAYLTSIYGHRSGVLTRMKVKEVEKAIGDDEKGYLINVCNEIFALHWFVLNWSM